MADLLENLNERQQEAVLETEGYVRVIAGAGSGKTKLLVSRYAYLVQDYGIDPANILCVTFTNKAAGEMKKRIRALIGGENEISLVCTYHGFCNRLLRENPEKLFLSRQFQIIDSQQQKAILSEIYQKFELKLDYASFESMLRKIGHVKRDTGYVPRMCSPKPVQILPEIRNQDDRIMEEFLQRQKATYSLDFHDLISFALYLLETEEAVREKWQDRLNYIMVDEFQDSSSTEMRLVELLSGKYRNLMIVGDPDQNIYEWRGSDVRLLVDFDKTHEPTRTIILNQNYRSTPQILRCANTLIEKNEIRLKKDLFTRNLDGKPVVHYHSKDDFEEMDRVIENIKLLQVKEGLRYSDFAILYRSGFLSRVAEKKLVEKNIPYEIFGGVRFYQRMEILDMLAYLKLIAYGDDMSFRRIVNTPRRRFGRAKMGYLEELREHGAGSRKGGRDQPFGQMAFSGLGPEGQGWLSVSDLEPEGQGRFSASGTEVQGQNRPATLFETLAGHLEDREFQNSDAGAFVQFIRGMQESHHTQRISEIVNRVAEDSGYEGYIRELGDEERLDNLAEFKRIANELEREFGEDLSLEDFLRQIALQSGEEGDEEKDAVKLMTIHSSKGLEFPVVFILGFTEGIFPSSKTLGERKKLGLEEERRLCYVAITRAQRYLFLMESEGTSQNGMQKLVSRFLEEIGEENYVRIGRISEELWKESRGYAAKLNRELQQEPVSASRQVGDGVEHHVFGKGRIEAIDAKRGSYSIRFERLQLPRNISADYFLKGHEKIDRKTILPAEEPGGAERKSLEAGPIAGWEELGTERKSLEAGPIAGREAPEAECTAGQEPTEAEYTASQEESEAEHAAGREAPEVQYTAKPESTESESTIRKETVEITEKRTGTTGAAGTIEMATDETETAENPGKTNAPILQEPESIDAVTIKQTLLQQQKENASNLWKRDDVPHSGWTCVDVVDLGEPVGICQMCGYQIIRYAHQMEHPGYHHLSVGCVCAGKMEGDIANARRRESEFKKRQTRREIFFQKDWKRSQKGNEYLKIHGHIIVLYHNAKTGNTWRYSIDNEFCKAQYPAREQAVAAAFDALERLEHPGQQMGISR